MKKILHVSYSMDTGGGPLTIKRIVEDFPEYSYCVSGNPGVYMEHFQSILPPEHILILKGPNLILNLWLLVSFCKKQSIDILHVHGRGAASFARFVKLFCWNIKVIYTPNGFFPNSLPFGLRHFYILVERLLFAITDMVFFVSLSEQATFSKALGLRRSHEKFIYIQNYINADLVVTKSTLPYLHSSHQSPKYLFVGRFSLQKGVDILLESLRLVEDDFQLTIVGYGEMEKYLLAEIEKDDLKRKVVVLGKRNEAFRLMANFDALLLPSRFEGLPFTILEAMLYKIPLVVTPCNGTIDLVDQSNGYISTSISANAFAEAIRNFNSDFFNRKEKIQRMVAANYQKIVTDFSLGVVRDKIFKLYS